MAQPKYEPYDFANRRHIGPSPDEMAEMLQVVGSNTLDLLIDQTVPDQIRQTAPLDWGPALSERATLDRLRDGAYRLVLEGDSYRRPKPLAGEADVRSMLEPKKKKAAVKEVK